MNTRPKYKLGDPYNHSITLRITDSQFLFLSSVSQALNISPSEYLRMTLDTLSSRFYASQVQKGGDLFEN